MGGSPFHFPYMHESLNNCQNKIPISFAVKTLYSLSIKSRIETNEWPRIENLIYSSMGRALCYLKIRMSLVDSIFRISS